MTFVYIYKLSYDVEMSGEEKESEDEKKTMQLLEGNIRLHKFLYESYMTTTLEEYEEFDLERYLAFIGVEINDGDFTKWKKPSPNTLTSLIDYYLDTDEHHNIVFTDKNKAKLTRWRKELESRFSKAEKERERRVKTARDRQGNTGRLRI